MTETRPGDTRDPLAPLREAAALPSWDEIIADLETWRDPPSPAIPVDAMQRWVRMIATTLEAKGYRVIPANLAPAVVRLAEAADRVTGPRPLDDEWEPSTLVFQDGEPTPVPLTAARIRGRGGVEVNLGAHFVMVRPAARRHRGYSLDMTDGLGDVVESRFCASLPEVKSVLRKWHSEDPMRALRTALTALYDALGADR